MRLAYVADKESKNQKREPRTYRPSVPTPCEKSGLGGIATFDWSFVNYYFY